MNLKINTILAICIHVLRRCHIYMTDHVPIDIIKRAGINLYALDRCLYCSVAVYKLTYLAARIYILYLVGPAVHAAFNKR